MVGAGLAIALVFQSCERKAQMAAPPNDQKATKNDAHHVYAAWYDVPADSLAKRRAGASELTAAHNQLPLGTLVRVTHLQNGKAVNVRITDRGIRRRKIKLDLCKEAAEQLEMVSEGIAWVRMELVPGEPELPDSKTTAAYD